jgi:hypothetical protein
MDALFHTEAFEYSPSAGSNFVTTTKGLSETNRMPGHGKNVHEEALSGTCNYHSFEATLAAVQKARFSHSPYASQSILCFRNLAFERSATMVTDIQCLLFATCGPEPVVTSVRLAEPGRPFIEATVVTAYPQHIVKRISEHLVLMDRHGFHIARGTVRINNDRRRKFGPSPVRDLAAANNKEAGDVLKYSASVRQLPQKDRHFKLDGLPCVPVRVECASVAQPVQSCPPKYAETQREGDESPTL